jgi:hypothetical protein
VILVNTRFGFFSFLFSPAPGGKQKRKEGSFLLKRKRKKKKEKRKKKKEKEKRKTKKEKRKTKRKNGPECVARPVELPVHNPRRVRAHVHRGDDDRDAALTTKHKISKRIVRCPLGSSLFRRYVPSAQRKRPFFFLWFRV